MVIVKGTLQAVRLVHMFSSVGDTVLDPFCRTGTMMVVTLRYNRNSIGVEIDPEYCLMAAAYLKAESNNLFIDIDLIFENAEEPRAAWVVRENQEFCEVRPAKKNCSRTTSHSINDLDSQCLTPKPWRELNQILY